AQLIAEIARGGRGGGTLPGVIAAEPMLVVQVDHVSPRRALGVGALDEPGDESARREARRHRLPSARGLGERRPAVTRRARSAGSGGIEWRGAAVRGVVYFMG